MQILKIVELLHNQCKKQYYDQQEIVDKLDFRDTNFQVENYITGYLKGQFKIMEHLLRQLS